MSSLLPHKFFAHRLLQNFEKSVRLPSASVVKEIWGNFPCHAEIQGPSSALWFGRRSSKEKAPSLHRGASTLVQFLHSQESLEKIEMGLRPTNRVPGLFEHISYLHGCKSRCIFTADSMRSWHGGRSEPGYNWHQKLHLRHPERSVFAWVLCSGCSVSLRFYFAFPNHKNYKLRLT